MKVILRENIENLGRIGDVVRVSAGYARNFLIPRNLVVLADEQKVKEIEHHKRVLDKKRAASKAIAEELAKKLSDQQITFTRKVGKGDKLFGSVTTADIAGELEKAGFTVDKSQVVLEENLKTIGVHPVTIKVQPEVTATVKVWVAKEEGSEPAAE